VATLTYDFEDDTIFTQPAGWEVIDYGAGTPISNVEPTNGKRYQLNCSGGIYAKCTDITSELEDILITGTSNCGTPFGGTFMVFARHNEGNIGSWNAYRMYVQASGVNDRIVYLDKFVSGSGSALANSGAFSLYYTLSVAFKFEVVGQIIRAKLWESGTAEPAGWTVSTTDGDITSGKIGFGSSGTGSSYYDNLSIYSDDIVIDVEAAQDPVGEVTVTGYNPVVYQGITLVPRGSGSLAGEIKIASYNPTIAAQPINVYPTLGTLSVSGLSPTVVGQFDTTVAQDPVGAVSITGYNPVVTLPNIASPAGSLVITGFDPTVAAEASNVHLYIKFKDAAGNVWTREIDSKPTVAEVTTTYIASSRDEIILADATGGAFNVTLPSPTGRTGFIYRIKKIDSSVNAVTVVGTIDEDSNFDLEVQDESITVTSDGTEWWII